MLVVRDPQLAALQARTDERFVEALVPYFFRHHRHQCEWLGRERVTSALRDGLARARRNGVETERSLCLYLGLLFGLGSAMDEDPQLPWVARVLAAREGEAARIERLHAVAMGYFDRVAGPDNGALVKALVRVRDYDPRGVLAFSRDAAKTELAGLLARLHPEKARELGEDGLRRLVEDGHRGAARYGLKDLVAVATFTTLRYMLGSGFDEDLLHPWAGEILRDGDGEKATRLRARAMAFLNEVGLRGGRASAHVLG